MAAVRRHLIIEPQFQARFTWAFLKGTVLAAAIPAFTLFFTILSLSKNEALTEQQRLSLVIASQHLFIFFTLVLLAVAVLSAVVGLVLSHRYAGPLKRVESWVARRLLGEEAEPLSVRPNDELARIASIVTALALSEKQRP